MVCFQTMAEPIAVENNGYGKPCVIFQCGKPASWTLRTIVQLEFFGRQVEQRIEFRLCHECKSSLELALKVA
jgi:hypothetical protein